MNKGTVGYLFKFILLHVFTYTLVGVIFYNLQNYEEAFDTMEYFKLFRPLDHPLVALAMPIQIIRGAVLALFIYPFYSTLMKKSYGWLLLFGLLFGFTAVVAMLPDMIETIATRGALAELIVGPIEITIQMLLFSWLFIKWVKRSHRKKRA